MPPGCHALVVAQLAASVQLSGTGRIHRAIEGDLLSLGAQIACGADLSHAQLPIGVQLDIATAGDQLAIKFYTYPSFCTHQLDRPGVHAAQRRRVDGQRWFGGAVVSASSGRQCAGVDIVAPGDDGQVAGLDLGVDLRAAGDDLEAIDIAGIEPRPFDDDLALVDLVTGQLAILDHRSPRAQRGPRRVDEAATVTGDAVGVGDDDVCPLPCNFGVAAQLAGVGTVDFVEDGSGGAALQIGVAKDNATQLGRLGPPSGIVEDDALLTDVVITEAVVREPAAVGRSDVDDRYAIARPIKARPRRTDHDSFARLGP